MAVYGEDVPSTMGGVVCYGPGDYRHEDGITVPAPGPGEVLLKVVTVYYVHTVMKVSVCMLLSHPCTMYASEGLRHR